jgi:hypothetical protein
MVDPSNVPVTTWRPQVAPLNDSSSATAAQSHPAMSMPAQRGG